MRNIAHVFLAMLVCPLVMACSSSGASVQRAITAPRTINPPVDVHPDVSPFIPRFTAKLEALGFRVAPTSDPEALQFRLDFNPSVMNLRVSASLWQHGVPVVSAEAGNSGWGTALARSTALSNRVDAAAEQFATQLNKVSSKLTIRDDSHIAVPDSLADKSEHGTVEIDANVPNAEVFIDGKFVGNTPLRDYRLAPGEHEILISSPGHSDWKRTLMIRSRTPTRVVANLQP